MELPTSHAAKKDLNYYLPLCRAIVTGDWEKAKRFFDNDSNAKEARITEDKDTPLLLAVKRGCKFQLLEKLVEMMPPRVLELGDDKGSTTLHVAAALGDTQAAKLLVRKHPSLFYIRNNAGYLPVHLAAMHGKRETTFYLLVDAKDDEESNPFGDDSVPMLMHYVINARFYDAALYLLQRYPWLVKGSLSPLEGIAHDPCVFPSRARFNIWQRFIYSCAPLNLRIFSNYDEEDTENTGFQFCKGNCIVAGCKKKQAVIWEILGKIVPYIKCIGDTKLLHCQAIILVRSICKEVVNLNNEDSSTIFRGALLLAAKYGISEIVEEILKVFPSAITFKDENEHTSLHLAVMYRHEKVFNFLYQQSGEYIQLLSQLDSQQNNILHLAGYSAHQDLDFASTAILQVQRELRWYKEVEKLVLPGQKEAKNCYGKTPLRVFLEEHATMVQNEEQWMKGMATSCTAATLIGTVAFTAAITLPGANNDEGFPIISKEAAHIIFNIANALTLFSSLSTVIIFLSILISHYAIIDFLHSAPKRLIMGLVSLFLSVTFMILSFSATLCFVSGQKKIILFLVVILACIPVTLFVFLQFPLLLAMIRSTYFPRFFTSHKSN
ncbi:hypothetical protein F0562_012112 [Nyssa sinensis]|uniref:PGG domain-containing protein n=1 Tax=Nyssa sinensis TaxID=561372 RepID=A0A5J4ZRU5_9ASTE|nr:hypothetical protein F0562_012112 [Nyssa sinensis]